MLVSTVGLAVGCVTPVKDLLFGEDPPLGFFTESLSIMAGGMIPCMMLVLGSVLHKGPGSAKVPKRVIFGILATRQIIIPILGKMHMLSIEYCINPKFNPPSPASASRRIPSRSASLHASQAQHFGVQGACVLRLSKFCTQIRWP